MTDPRTLLAFVDDEFDDDIASALRALPDSLADREWVLAPPEFVEGTDDDGAPFVGIEFQIAAEPDDATDRAQLAEVRDLVEALSEVSAAGCDIVVELDDDEIGEIQQGAMTPGLRFDLIGAWQERLA